MESLSSDNLSTPLSLGEGQGVRLIKSELRAMMNGVASATMRNSGMTADYRVNFGVELPRLTTLADEIRKETADATEAASLAQALWKESVRECRILATMLYPTDKFDAELADIWASDIHSAELSQIAALNLFSRFHGASTVAFQWIASTNEQLQITGYYTIAHLLRQNQLTPRSEQELNDQASTAVLSDNQALRTAAQRALARLTRE